MGSLACEFMLRQPISGFPDFCVAVNMAFTSKLDWDTDINVVGGQKNVLLVDSPFSDHPSANAAQGALTYGNLVNEFKPPKIEISPIDNGYYIHSRMHTGAKNSAVDIIAGNEPSTPAVAAKAAAQGGNVAAAVATAEAAKLTAASPAAKPTPAPAKAAGQGKEGFRECMRQKTYVAPSRQGQKNVIDNPARGAILEDGVNTGADGFEASYEGYTEMPEFVGSNIHQEAFGINDIKSNKLIYTSVILIAIMTVIYVVALILNKVKPDMLPDCFRKFPGLRA